MTLEELSQTLHRRFGDDAAQYALLRIVEKGWAGEADLGENILHYGSRVAHNFRLTRYPKAMGGYREVPTDLFPDDGPSLSPLQPPDQLNRLVARETLKRLNGEALLLGMGYSVKEAAHLSGVPAGTIQSRAARRREKLRRDDADPAS